MRPPAGSTSKVDTLDLSSLVAALFYNGSDSCMAHGIALLRLAIEMLQAFIRHRLTSGAGALPLQDEELGSKSGQLRDRRLHTMWLMQMEKESCPGLLGLCSTTDTLQVVCFRVLCWLCEAKLISQMPGGLPQTGGCGEAEGRQR